MGGGADGKNRRVEKQEEEGANPPLLIHAPEMGATLSQKWNQLTHFVSIHAPAGGCDLSASTVGAVNVTFQFTHLVRGATKARSRALSSADYNHSSD